MATLTSSGIGLEPAKPIDPITVEVVAHRLNAVSEEMMATLVRTAYSPNIKERRDCSVGIFDAQGDLVAMTAIGPIHLSSLMGLVENVKRRFSLQSLRPGDCFMTNDPYVGGGSHLPDITLVSPVFVADRVVAFVASLAHHSDVGGKVAGSESADCTSIFQEGLRIPPVRLVDAGVMNQDILSILLLNTRMPNERKGDISAQLAANAIGVRRLTETFERFGSVTARAVRAFLDYGEARARAGIERLPDGVYEHEELLDSDGISDRDVRLKVAIAIRQDRIRFDFSGTDPQVAGARNMPLVATLSCVYYAVKALVDPDLPPNAGYFRAIEVFAPEGAVLNPTPPAAVGDRVASANIVGDLLFGALASAVPDRVSAGCGPLHGLIFSGVDPRTGQYFVDYETYAGAAGALIDQDGRDAVRVHVSGSANLPIESVEQEFPLLVQRYELIPDSGGAGTFRGGLGTRRDVTVLATEARIAGRGLRQRRGAPGVFGGGDGSAGRFILHPDDPREVRLAGSFSELSVAAGTTVRVETPAGAGFGDPLERAPERVLQDVIAGKVSAAAAQARYGVVIEDDMVDEKATEARRRAMRQEARRHD